MPLYDFVCGDCEAAFEELVKSADAVAGVRCAKCGSARVERQIGVFAAAGGRAGSARAPELPAPRPPRGGCGSGCGCH